MTSVKQKEPIHIHYHYEFEDGSSRKLSVLLDPETLSLINEQSTSEHEWARLDFEQCRVCKLKKEENPFCPVAVSLERLIDTFKDVVSFNAVTVYAVVDGRTISKEVSVQVGVQSLMGIHMVASGCPSMEKLKPMVRFHLPFASTEETMYRVVSMYLCAQFFRHKKHLPIDMDLQGLKSIYEEVHKVNVDFLKRLKKASSQDANLNSLVTLDSFAMMVPFSISKSLNNLEYLFSAYIEK